mmetsp:Transcript_64846/g.163368  ORF Transcript_64846/g.163368 Transcript_64846/m.163368 type:complete len:201 (+) Transcript_64846:915-1517(+)
MGGRLHANSHDTGDACAGCHCALHDLLISVSPLAGLPDCDCEALGGCERGVLLLLLQPLGEVHLHRQLDGSSRIRDLDVLARRLPSCHPLRWGSRAPRGVRAPHRVRPVVPPADGLLGAHLAPRPLGGRMVAPARGGPPPSGTAVGMQSRLAHLRLWAPLRLLRGISPEGLPAHVTRRIIRRRRARPARGACSFSTPCST